LRLGIAGMLWLRAKTLRESWHYVYLRLNKKSIRREHGIIQSPPTLSCPRVQFAFLRVLRGSVVNWKLELVAENAPQNLPGWISRN